MKELRGKTNFNYDLRKKLSPGQKAAISRAWNDYRVPTSDPRHGSEFVPIRRNPGETNRQYRRRVNRIQDQFGQKESILNGLSLALPRDPETGEPIPDVRIRGERVHFETEGMREYFIPVDAEELLENIPAYIQSLVSAYQPDAIIPLMGPYRYHGAFGSDQAVDLINLIEEWAEKYQEAVEAALNGFIMRNYAE